MNLEKEVGSLKRQIEFTEYSICPQTEIIAIDILEAVDARFGDNSVHPLEYHNAQHAVDVVRRGIRLANALMPDIEPKYQRNIYDLIFIGGASHDYEVLTGSGQNEVLSADFADQTVRSHGYNPEINNKRFLKRLRSGIRATQVSRDTDGKIEQVNIRKGERDPFKFILATADINGIAMDGPKRMVSDAVNLCYELSEQAPTPDELYEFILFQQKFLRDRLHDDQTKPDIAYYFGDKAEEVYQLASKEFSSTIKKTYSIACGLSDNPIIHKVINENLKAVSTLPGSSFLQGKLVDALNL